MLLSSGRPRVSRSIVQSFAADMPSGLGANRPASSTLFVPTRSSGAFSQTHPPCMFIPDHHRRERHRDPRVDGAEDERLRPPAARAGHGDAGRVHVRQAEHEVQRADAVPRLQAHQALQPQASASTSVNPLRCSIPWLSA